MVLAASWEQPWGAREMWHAVISCSLQKPAQSCCLVGMRILYLASQWSRSLFRLPRNWIRGQLSWKYGWPPNLHTNCQSTLFSALHDYFHLLQRQGRGCRLGRTRHAVQNLCGMWSTGPPLAPDSAFFLCSQPWVSLYNLDGSCLTLTSTWCGKHSG